MPPVLVTDLVHESRIFRLVPRRVKSPHQRSGLGMAKIIKFFVQQASAKKTIVDKPVAQYAQVPPQGIVTIKDLSDPIVNGSGTRVTLNKNLHLDSAARSLHEGLCQPLIPEIVGNPEYFPSRRNSMYTLFQQVSQEPGGAIRTSPENLKGVFRSLTM